QGEWFFIPAPRMKVEEAFVTRGEPLSRGTGSKSHMAECCYSAGGEWVYVCDQHPGGLTEAQQARLLPQRPETAHWNWRRRGRNAQVYVRGRVRHPDHRTIVLNSWHRVLMNTENQAPAMQHVTFLD